jgi:hypothetical protein
MRNEKLSTTGTPRRIPIPVNITFAGENACKSDIHGLGLWHDEAFLVIKAHHADAPANDYR